MEKVFRAVGTFPERLFQQIGPDDLVVAVLNLLQFRADDFGEVEKLICREVTELLGE